LFCSRFEADPKNGANPTMVRILRSTSDFPSQPEMIDGVSWAGLGWAGLGWDGLGWVGLG